LAQQPLSIAFPNSFCALIDLKKDFFKKKKKQKENFVKKTIQTTTIINNAALTDLVEHAFHSKLFGVRARVSLSTRRSQHDNAPPSSNNTHTHQTD